MSLYAAGDTAAFPELYAALAPRLRAWVRRRTRDPSEADDVVQQTFLQLHAARGRFQPGRAVVPWACTIAARLLADRRRAAVRWSRVLGAGDPERATDPGPVPDDELVARELVRRADAVLAALPARQRDAFCLVRLDGCSVADAARATRSSASGVKSSTHRATVALARALCV